MARALLLLAVTLLSTAVAFPYIYVTSGTTDAWHIRENAAEGSSASTFTFPWPSANRIHVDGSWVFAYNTLNGTIWTRKWNPYAPIVDHYRVITTIGTGKSNVLVFAARSLDSLWYVADGKLWRCALSSCSNSTNAIATVSQTDFRVMQLMKYGGTYYIMLRKSASTNHRAFNAYTGTEGDADALESWKFTYLLTTYSAYVQGRIIYHTYTTEQNYTFWKDTMFVDGQRVFALGSSNVLDWFAVTRYYNSVLGSFLSVDTVTTTDSTHVYMYGTEGIVKGTKVGTQTITAIDGMNPDTRFDVSD